LPVTLKNRIENGPSTDFGSLWANNHQVPSGNPESFRFFTESNSVQHYTLETTYNNERKYSFNWTYANVNVAGNQNYFSPYFGFTIPINLFTKEVTRSFRTVYPLTIKNSAIEFTSTESFGNVSFKDPTTDNQFYNYPADGVGYVKNEAFKNLEVDPGNGNLQYYSVKAITPASYNGRNYYWFSGDFNPSAQIDLLITEPTTKTAYFKGTQLSNDINAYNHNNQRKFVRSDNGALHNIYVSLGALWYERSTDGGQSWQISGGNPVNINNPKSASISYLPGVTVDDYVLIAYQCTSPNGSQVWLDVFKNGTQLYGTGFHRKVVEFVHSPNEYDDYNAEPVVALNAGTTYKKDFMVVFKDEGFLPLGEDNPASPGLYRCLGYLNPTIYYQIEWHNTDITTPVRVQIPTTGSNSIHPAIAGELVINSNQFHIAYQENNKIKYYYCFGQSGTQNINSLGSPYFCSNFTGFTQHYFPSIISMGTTARVSWRGYRMVYYEENQEVDAMPQYRVLFRRPDQTTYWQFGNNVSNPSINKNNYHTYYAMAWSEDENSIKFADNTLSTVRTITGVTGQQLQVSNGSDKNNMYCMAYEHYAGVPFYFERSNNLGIFYTPQSKITNVFFATGREGVLTIDSAGFYFAIGDVNVDGDPVEFIEISDTAVISNQQSLNQYLMTGPINISDNSSFLYSVQYGITDSLSALQAITGERFINFKVQLVDDNIGELIGEFDNVSYTANNLYLYNNISYQVSTQGIGNRTVRLKLVVDNNFEADYSLSGIYSDESVLNKTSVKQISYTGGEVIKSYELSQNYPNPFNPSTTIKFQIPTSGDVSLKIYDILGNEITTLVEEFMETGKYEVNFNASSLASGVYIYRPNVNDFVNVKKMVLLK